jgi:hypothetical protein
MDRYAGSGREGDIEPDVVPDDAPRRGITVRTNNDTGMTTPPISGWGDTLPEAVEAQEEGDERTNRS